METLYKVITKTDPYHASRYPGFNREGIRVEEACLYRDQAVTKLLNIVSLKLGEFFFCWDDLVFYAKKHKDEIDVFEYPDGTASVVCDIFTFEIVEEEN